VVQVDKLMNQ